MKDDTNDGRKSYGCLFQGYQDAHDKRPRQYPATPKSKGRTLQHCRDFTSQSVLTSGYVCHDISGQNHGPTLKNWLFLLSEICMVTHLPNCCGKDNSTKFCWKMDGRRYQTGKDCLCIVSKVYSCLYSWMTSI